MPLPPAFALAALHPVHITQHSVPVERPHVALVLEKQLSPFPGEFERRQLELRDSLRHRDGGGVNSATYSMARVLATHVGAPAAGRAARQRQRDSETARQRGR